MIILGIDPGYSNLGVAVVDLGGPTPQVLWSDCIHVGAHSSRPEGWAARLIPKLDDLAERFAPQVVATETPPFITPTRKMSMEAVGRLVKTSALLSRVSGMIQGWAHSRGLDYGEIAPVALKRHVAKRLGIRWNRKFMPKKSEVGLCVKEVFGASPKTDHEQDAVMIAHLYHSRLASEAA